MAKIINNNIYMLKYILKFCPSHFFIVIFTAILGCSTSVVNILCMRQFVNTISGTDGLSTLHTTFIFFCYWNILVILLNLVIQQLIIPINTQKIHQKMQHEIFKKTLELDLAHYENSDFYDKYNMALQQSDTRALAVLNSLSVLISSLLGISTLTVLVSSIEPLILLIVVFNVAISFLVSLLSTKIQHRFFKERIHPQRENGYVQRIFYIRDFAQELRLFTSLPKILTNKFDESFSSLQSLTKLYGKKGLSFGA